MLMYAPLFDTNSFQQSRILVMNGRTIVNDALETYGRKPQHLPADRE
jgi:hypothetical protein